jgi:hypothetical protein
MCDLSVKKCKRSFSEAWLSDDRYKSWIRKVPLNENLFHCIICNKDISCNTHISRHADSTCHKNNIKNHSFVLANNIQTNAINNDATIPTMVARSIT